MRNLFIALMILLPATLQAQTTFQFAPSFGYSWARFENDLFVDNSLFGPSAKVRFVADRNRLQVGGGVEFSLISDAGTGTDVIDGSGTAFVCPHFFFNYKVAKFDNSYVYTGLVLGGAFAEDGFGYSGSFAKGLTGLDAGYVIQVGKKVAVDISESLRFMNGRFNDYNIQPLIVGPTTTFENYFYVYTLTTNIGIRIINAKD
ncbi:MAG: hypothetical protein H6551_13600 [Chitinophagales bacterium]|nr:hypothetical protein [Chitinophagaceae bacterium]MCB9066169.1 hypothetical protein [Chitinophagales bacterium]